MPTQDGVLCRPHFWWQDTELGFRALLCMAGCELGIDFTIGYLAWTSGLGAAPRQDPMVASGGLSCDAPVIRSVVRSCDQICGELYNEHTSLPQSVNIGWGIPRLPFPGLCFVWQVKTRSVLFKGNSPGHVYLMAVWNPGRTVVETASRTAFILWGSSYPHARCCKRRYHTWNIR